MYQILYAFSEAEAGYVVLPAMCPQVLVPACGLSGTRQGPGASTGQTHSAHGWTSLMVRAHTPDYNLISTWAPCLRPSCSHIQNSPVLCMLYSLSQPRGNTVVRTQAQGSQPKRMLSLATHSIPVQSTDMCAAACHPLSPVLSPVCRAVCCACIRLRPPQ
jgi:hypothetical protein